MNIRVIRLRRVLSSRAGASLLFVLAVMMLLTSIAASVFVAASAGAGVANNQIIRGQMELYADSMQKSMMYSLQNKKETGEIQSTKTLAGQLMRTLYNKAWAQMNVDGIDFIDYKEKFTLAFDVPQLSGFTNNMSCYTISIDVEPRVQLKREYIEEVDYFDSVKEEWVKIKTFYPREANLAANIFVQVEVNYKGKSLLSVASYKYKNGILLSDGSVDQPTPTKVEINQWGDWRFVSHDKTEIAAGTTS